MSRIWLPSQNPLALALREPALLVPEALPLGNVKPRQCLKPVSVLILRPGQETRDLCGFRWLKGGTPSFAWRTEIASNPLGVQGDIIQSPAFYSMLCSSTSNYLYSQHPALRDLPLGNEFTFTALSYQSNGGISTPAAFGWSGTDDLLLYKARSVSSPPNTPTVFWRDIGGIVLVPSVAADALYNWSVETVVGRVNGASIDLSLYSNGVLIASNSVSAAGRGPFTQMELGRWESQTMGNTSAVSMFGAFSRAWSAAEVEAHARDVFGYLIEPAANEPIFIGTAAGGPATITGTGALAAGAASVAGTAERELTATGALSSQAAAVAGTGAVSGVVTGTGALAAQAATVAGTAERELTATGALSAQTAAVAGTAEREITGTGAPASTAATMSGTGTVTSPGVHTGTGAVAAQAATMTGAGILARDGTGVLAAGVATINATGIIARDATGALAAQAAAIAGTGVVSVPGVVTGTGVLAGLSAAVSGTGTVQTPDGWTPVPTAGGTWSDIAAATSTWTEI